MRKADMEKTGFLERQFRLKENGTTVATEFTAGLTTFMTMAYILAVNPMILSSTGMDAGAVFTATVIASIIGTVLMALMANLPFALAPGMGLNAIFAFTICGAMGASWQTALTAVLIEGILFILLSVFNVREAIIDAIPMSLKNAISVGIGLFIALIGLLNAGIAVSGKTLLPDGTLTGLTITLGDLTSGRVLLAIIGIILTSVLIVKKVRGAMLIGILTTTLISVPMGVSSLEGFQLFQMPPSLAPIAFQFQLDQIFSPNMLIVLFTLLFVDIFDTVGTLIGVSSKAGLLDAEGKVPNAKKALLADAIATACGAVLGTSTVTTYVESASGVAAGGRTGLSSIFTSMFFVISLFFSGLFLFVPSEATAPALIIVGMYMMSPIVNIDWHNERESIPAFLTLAIMPFTYSIAEGITFGVLSYVLISLLSGNAKKLNTATYVLAAFLAMKIIFLFVDKFILLRL